MTAPGDYPSPILSSNFVGESEAAGVSAASARPAAGTSARNEPSASSTNESNKPTSFSPLLGTPAMPVNIRVQKQPQTGFAKFLNYLQIIVTIVFLLFLCFSLYRLTSASQDMAGTQSGGSFMAQKSNVKFADVQGCDEVKGQLEQIVDFLRSPEKYEKFGAEIPRGALLQGPPGVGKTLLAKAVAGEADVPFFSISGSEFDEVYVGVGAARVRALFRAARMHSKAVIFIDEIDAVGGKRAALDRSANRQTLNQLLVEMDGFNSKAGIVVMAATNAVEVLDQALLRPGRFDRTLTLHLPDINGRTAILKALLKKLPRHTVASDLSAESIARQTIGFSGADLAQVINQAKLFAALDKSATKITMAHLNKAVKFVYLGPERKLAMKPSERENTAYHEAGHAVVALATEGAMPVQSATIVPHGNTLGNVMLRPDDDLVSMTKKQLQASIDVTFGGFVAEELHSKSIDDVTLGAASDIASANQLAREMIKGGFGKNTRFLQPSANGASEAVREGIERDVQEILDESKKRVTALLQRERAAWLAIAKALLDKESLTREEIYVLWEANRSPSSLLKAKKTSTRRGTISPDETDNESQN